MARNELQSNAPGFIFDLYFLNGDDFFILVYVSYVKSIETYMN